MDIQDQLSHAAEVLNAGGVIAYPTEYCFGLGCDPRNSQAIKRILNIKQRQAEQGLILIAANHAQIGEYAELDDLDMRDEILDSWPGPNTWLLPAKDSVSNLVRGHHLTIAMRIPGHNFCRDLCTQFGHALVSTSANRHGQPSLLTAAEVEAEMQAEVDFIVCLPIDGGIGQASTIRDSITGEVLR